MNTRLQATLSVVVMGLAGCAKSAPSESPFAQPPSPAAIAAAATPAAPSMVAAFDPAAGELPEGVATKDGFAYVGFAPVGEIARVDLRTGSRAHFAKLPKPVPGKGFMTGLAFGPDGLLYAALVSFDPTVQQGIYRVGSTGGDATLFAKDPKMVFPNGLSFDATGKLFVTDSAAGAIFEIARTGAVSPW